MGRTPRKSVLVLTALCLLIGLSVLSLAGCRATTPSIGRAVMGASPIAPFLGNTWSAAVTCMRQTGIAKASSVFYLHRQSRFVSMPPLATVLRLLQAATPTKPDAFDYEQGYQGELYFFVPENRSGSGAAPTRCFSLPARRFFATEGIYHDPISSEVFAAFRHPTLAPGIIGVAVGSGVQPDILYLGVKLEENTGKTLVVTALGLEGDVLEADFRTVAVDHPFARDDFTLPR